MLLHQAIVAFGGGSGIPALEEVIKQSEVDGGDENNGVPRDHPENIRPSAASSWISPYVDELSEVGASTARSMMNMNCGWHGLNDDGAFGTTKADTCNTVAPPELWEPIPPTPDCPICLVPITLDRSMVMYYSCCEKEVCYACHKEYRRSVHVMNSSRKAALPTLQISCLFCRSSLNRSDAVFIESYKARARRGDGRAAWNLASFHQKGKYGLPMDKSRALQMFHTAANLGSVEATSHLGYLYTVGQYSGTDTQVVGNMYLKAAALKGDVHAHKDLADIEFDNGNCQLAMKHLKLAASAGHIPSIKRLWVSFQKKELSKADLEETLWAHKAACDQMISIQRTRLLAYEAAKEGNDELLTEHYESYYEGKISAKVLERVVTSHQSLHITK